MGRLSRKARGGEVGYGVCGRAWCVGGKGVWGEEVRDGVRAGDRIVPYSRVLTGRPRRKPLGACLLPGREPITRSTSLYSGPARPLPRSPSALYTQGAAWRRPPPMATRAAASGLGGLGSLGSLGSEGLRGGDGGGLPPYEALKAEAVRELLLDFVEKLDDAPLVERVRLLEHVARHPLSMNMRHAFPLHKELQPARRRRSPPPPPTPPPPTPGMTRTRKILSTSPTCPRIESMSVSPLRQQPTRRWRRRLADLGLGDPLPLVAVVVQGRRTPLAVVHRVCPLLAIVRHYPYRGTDCARPRWAGGGGASTCACCSPSSSSVLAGLASSAQGSHRWRAWARRRRRERWWRSRC